MAAIASNLKKLNLRNFRGRVAIITGGSRGIGRECALALASQGCSIVVAAKTTKPQPTLPGTIYTVAEEVRSCGAEALPFKCNLLEPNDIQACVDATMETFGRVDFLINNASALWWQDIVDTPPKRYDLINQINARGTFLMTRAVLPHMDKAGFGRIVNMSPPISAMPQVYAGRTAYNISKMGMTMVALGVAAEYEGKDITANSLWPATVIESLASKNFKLGSTDMWRKASILSDATLSILSQDSTFTGRMLIDDDFLRTQGLTDEDFKVYRYNPDVEPPRVLAAAEMGEIDGRGFVRRGSVTRLQDDMDKSSRL